MQSQATYNYKVVRQFAVMTVIWGIVGMLVGVIIAAQLVWPELNVHEFLSYGRLRPLHTNAVIFAFGGCALVRHVLLLRAAHQPCAAVRAGTGGIHLLGLATGHRAGGAVPAAGIHLRARNTPNSNGRSTS
jgi:cbb3-type cytochrome oxidase subunit 1